MDKLSISDWIGLIGIAVSLVGFGLTIWQLVRTANASIATKNAIASANRRMLLNHLLVLLPQLSTFEADLDAAILADDKPGATRALVQFSHAANQVAALLESHDGAEDADLANALRLSAKNASTNKAVIVSGVSRPLSTVLKTVAAEIGEMAGKCSGISVKYQVKAG